MAPLQSRRSISSSMHHNFQHQDQDPHMAEHAPPSMAHPHFYSSNSSNSLNWSTSHISTSHLSTILSTTSDLDLDNSEHSAALSPRTLYAQSFDRPASARSLPSGPSGRFRKNMKDITGFGTTEEDFDALPIAIQRKYFSTLERLRFAQNSRSNALNELPIQKHRKTSIADRRGINVALIEPRRSSSRRSRKLARNQSVSSTEASWFLTLPDKIKKKQFTREEQVVLAARLRESVILDAADEAIYKASRRASRNLGPLLDLSRTSTPRSSMESTRQTPVEPTSAVAAEMYESFRWMDEEEDLDLKLVLDDYHANLDGVVIPTPSSTRRPSFRRQMSITKMPFGRNSLSSLGPRSPKFESPTGHARNKSRTLSLIAPKHVPKASVASIDPNAAHYQDPEARLKLRVYLASPQKFDEAIEFGFPSMDGIADNADKENRPPKHSSKDNTKMKKSFTASEMGQSFLADDAASLFEDDASMADPDSPLTPLGELGFRSSNHTSGTTAVKSSKSSSDYAHLGLNKPTVVKESYTQAMAGNREMTLRMTLTRPDLRADENAIYGWQATKSPLQEDSPHLDEKHETKGPFGGADGWGPAEKENGVVKRFWNKMKSSQKKPM